MASNEQENSSKREPQPQMRILESADFQAFLDLRLSALQESPQSFGADYQEWLLRPREEILKIMAPDADAFVLGAFKEPFREPFKDPHKETLKESLKEERGGPSLAGIAGFRRRKGIKVRHIGEIWGVYVDIKFRGSGIGKALMIELIKRARTISGLERLVLSVVTINEGALALYKSLEFQSYGREPNALKIDETYLDEELMSLDLCSTDIV